MPLYIRCGSKEERAEDRCAGSVVEEGGWVGEEVEG